MRYFMHYLQSVYFLFITSPSKQNNLIRSSDTRFVVLSAVLIYLAFLLLGFSPNIKAQQTSGLVVQCLMEDGETLNRTLPLATEITLGVISDERHRPFRYVPLILLRSIEIHSWSRSPNCVELRITTTSGRIIDQRSIAAIDELLRVPREQGQKPGANRSIKGLDLKMVKTISILTPIDLDTYLEQMPGIPAKVRYADDMEDEIPLVSFVGASPSGWAYGVQGVPITSVVDKAPISQRRVETEDGTFITVTLPDISRITLEKIRSQSSKKNSELTAIAMTLYFRDGTIVTAKPVPMKRPINESYLNDTLYEFYIFDDLGSARISALMYPYVVEVDFR